MLHNHWKDFLAQAYWVAKESPDPSTQNGALLINNSGYIVGQDFNRFPKGVQYRPERWERPIKYKFIEHAERNVILKMAKQGIKTEGLIMVCPWAACSDCARAIIESGVAMLVTHKQAHDRSPDFWRAEIDVAMTMFQESAVKVVMYDGVIGVGQELRHSGQLWTP